MKIEVRNIAEKENDFEVEFFVDQKTLKSLMRENRQKMDDDFVLRSIDLENRAIQDLLEYVGMLTRFSKDYWAYRDGKGQPLPWDYGDHDSELVKKVLHHYGV